MSRRTLHIDSYENVRTLFLKQVLRTAIELNSATKRNEIRMMLMAGVAIGITQKTAGYLLQ